ncbi:hypothetical protein [Mesobacillus foraminis]|uniref:hypothetical protein n=1 Tax=Mesobacillus foraminis TaxID=279826 RepID=UPI0013CE4C4A|nr:hypothetical protein [Mesobacillus foraminis]
MDKLSFKKSLTMIEQFAIKDFFFKWVGRPIEGLDDFLPLEYTEDVFAKLEAKAETCFFINENEKFRYVTLTEANQIVIGLSDSNQELKHRILYLDEI